MSLRNQRATRWLWRVAGLRRSLIATICAGSAVVAGFGDTPTAPQLRAAGVFCVLTAVLASGDGTLVSAEKNHANLPPGTFQNSVNYQHAGAERRTVPRGRFRGAP